MSRRLPPLLRLVLATAAVVAAGAVPAAAQTPASKLVIRGAGFGHGVGMSQYGALGLAQRGWTYQAILAHYYTGTSIQPLPAAQNVRVLLKSGADAKISGATAVAGSGIALDPSATYRVFPSGLSRLAVADPTGRVLAVLDPPVRLSSSVGPLVLHGRADNGVLSGSYRGVLEVRLTALGSVRTIDDVGIEDYVRGVVGAEMSPSWPAAALDAQAVAARTYAVTTNKGGAGSGFSQYADTRSQVYMGVRGEAPQVDLAVQTTVGQVVAYAGKPAVTYFFSTSGGRTENVENGFPGADPEPWLVSVRDPYDKISPDHAWGPVDLTLTTVTRRLGSLVKGQFRNIRVLARGVSQRILRADVIGTGGTTRVTGDELAARLDLMSTWMTFRVYNASGKLVRAPKGSVLGTTPQPTTTTTTPQAPTEPGALAPAMTATAPTVPGGGAATPGATTDPASGGSVAP
jgi:stage II sporulation protein D